MESPDTAERKWACVAVSNLIQNDPSTRRLLQGRNVVGALITRLTDSEEEVVVEAIGALRYGFCVFCDLILHFLSFYEGIYPLTVDTTFVLRCTTKIFWRLWRFSSQRYGVWHTLMDCLVFWNTADFLYSFTISFRSQVSGKRTQNCVRLCG